MTTPTETITLVVDLPRDEMISRMASASLQVGVDNESVRRRVQILGGVVAALGIVATPLVSVWGLTMAIAGVVVVAVGGNRRAMIGRFAKVYERSRFTGEPFTVAITPQSLNIESITYAAQWRWVRLADVREHLGGLVLVWDGGLQYVDIPPSSFADDHQRVDVANVVRSHIAAARPATPVD